MIPILVPQSLIRLKHMDPATPHRTPCCQYEFGATSPPVFYNPYNKVVQCHNCGHTYTPMPLPVPDDIDVVLKDPDNHFLQWVEPWPGINEDGAHVDITMIQVLSVTDALALQRASVPYPVIPNSRDMLLDFISVHWARFVPPPTKCPTNPEQPCPNSSH